MNALAHPTPEPAALSAEPQPAAFATALRHASARRPCPPLRVLTAADAALAVRHAADEGLAVKLGDRPADHALVLDLSGMKRIVIDPRRRTARVQPGVSVAELEGAAARYGLFPIVEAAYLVAAEVVTRDGSIMRASEEAPELLELVRKGALLGFVVDSTYRLYAG
jgi:FAD/FMN-containing dehydrogenase